MRNFQNDQAAGLRRIMSLPKPRVVSILSAGLEATLPRMMTNLAASIQAQGSQVLLMHASAYSRESQYALNKAASIYDICQNNDSYQNKTALQSAVKVSPYGFSLAKLMQKNQPAHLTSAHVVQTNEQHANQLVKQLATQFDIVLVDASVNDAGKLALPILNESEIIIQLSRKPESIKQAYALIKLICNQLGRRSFGIIVDDANEEQAQVVFRNVAQVAKRYLQIELEFFGAIPTDEKLSLATKLGRTVIDAFPLAKASAAFTSIAKKLDVQLDHAAPFKQAYR